MLQRFIMPFPPNFPNRPKLSVPHKKCPSCLQVVINNAGILYRDSVEAVSPEQMLESYKVNTMGPLFVVQALLQRNMLPSGSLVATLTSLVRLFFLSMCNSALVSLQSVLHSILLTPEPSVWSGQKVPLHRTFRLHSQ
jgi:NAD(P)-dependent dehydrogenase (short-subunit alcohol dehydrogenase family)